MREVEPVLTFIVKDKETGAGIANAYVYLRDGNHPNAYATGHYRQQRHSNVIGLNFRTGRILLRRQRFGV